MSDQKQEVVVTRVFDAPRERVWQAWTDPEQIKLWWGPKGFTSPQSEMDFRVGGKYFRSMVSGGFQMWSTGVFKEIIPYERLVMIDSFADEQGNVVPASHYGLSKDFDLEMQITVTFEEQDGKTKLTLRQTGFPAGPDIEGSAAGWSESFDKLAERLRQ